MEHLRKTMINKEDLIEDIDYCKTCKFAEISYTKMINGKIIPEWYCKLTHSDECCNGNDYEEYE